MFSELLDATDKYWPLPLIATLPAPNFCSAVLIAAPPAAVTLRE
jgi:hypothetical protein